MYKVKICGICDSRALNAAVKAGADYVGFIFYHKSRRYINIKRAKSLADSTPAGVLKVGLLVNPEDEDVKRVLGTVPIDIIQLHGTESPKRVLEIKEQTGLTVMKAIGIGKSSDLALVTEYGEVADQLLLDAKYPESGDVQGGLGKRFNWSILTGFKLEKTWFLAGGLNSRNLKNAVELTGATNFDVSSGVEDLNGKKSGKKISEFIGIVRGMSHDK